MSRKRRPADVLRLLRRHMRDWPDDRVKALRDELWDVLTEREFLRGYSIAWLAERQPTRNTTEQIEAAIRRRMR